MARPGSGQLKPTHDVIISILKQPPSLRDVQYSLLMIDMIHSLTAFIVGGVGWGVARPKFEKGGSKKSKKIGIILRRDHFDHRYYTPHTFVDP